MNNHQIIASVLRSWCEKDSAVNKTSDILEWIRKRNASLVVSIVKCGLEKNGFWFYDEEKGVIRNRNGSFFYIAGSKENYELNGKEIISEQPVIVQDEIGYLGIICREINGVMHFLMQAKIEPGNINKIQISPTIQATKSNFMQKHGGKRPAYIDYFIGVNKGAVVVDQIQSEQSSRFYKKRNRNIVIYLDEDIEVLESHKWMTLGQIKELMRTDNLVNMDTRTVLSCIPYCTADLTFEEKENLKSRFKDKSLFNSLFNEEKISLSDIYSKINDVKMFSSRKQRFVKLKDLSRWQMKDDEFVCKEPYPYKIVFCSIAIEGREVKKWTQPLFEANGDAVFGLFIRERNGKKEFLVKIKHEIGCFDNVELGPALQLEAVHNEKLDNVELEFVKRMNERRGVIFDHYLSEEGGRFYHEQNRNVLLMLEKELDLQLPKEYMWLDYKTLNYLIQFNNILNIQLRNLLSLLEA